RAQQCAGLGTAGAVGIRGSFDPYQAHLNGIFPRGFDRPDLPDLGRVARFCPGTDLGARRQRLASGLVRHHPTHLHDGITVAAVFLPHPFETVSARPIVCPQAVTAIVRVVTDVALADPWRTGAPHIHAFAMLPVVEELPFVAVAPSP